MSLRRQQAAALPESQSPVNSQNKRLKPYPLFLLHMQAQKKKLSKRKRRWGLTHMRSMCVGVAETERFRALQSATRTPRPRPRHLLRKRCTKTIMREGKSASLSNPVFAPVRESFHGELCEINLSVIAKDESLRQFIGNSNEFTLILFSR